jgi:hypothetical protein
MFGKLMHLRRTGAHAKRAPTLFYVPYLFVPISVNDRMFGLCPNLFLLFPIVSFIMQYRFENYVYVCLA